MRLYHQALQLSRNPKQLFLHTCGEHAGQVPDTLGGMAYRTTRGRLRGWGAPQGGGGAPCP